MEDVARSVSARARGVSEVARSASERGEVVLLRRNDESLELRVNGVYVMGSADTTSERQLASYALDALDPANEIRGLVGGLGLGHTLDEILRSQSVAQVVVVEIEPALIEWHRRGIIPAPSAAGVHVLDDPRVVVEIDDIRAAVEREASADSSYDLVLLDVDNGPGYLVYDANAAVYRDPFLRTCAQLVESRQGLVAVWSSSTSEALLEALATVFDRTEERHIPVHIGRRDTTYHLYLGSNGRAVAAGA